ncbi:MAG TPA: sodium/glutamate symporter [Thermomicrobiales bacterium]
MSAQDIGLAMVTLSLVFAGAALIRRWVRFLRSLFIPTAVIGGFLGLVLGPEVLGRLTDGEGIFSSATFRVWEVTPGLLINVMCASLLLGERLPPVKTIWSVSAPHVIMAGIASAGQYAIGGILVLLLIRPLWDTPPEAGALIEMSFAGGHGTLAGLSGVLDEHGVGELLDVGLGLATIGMVTGVVVGTLLVNYAVKSPSIPIARQNPTTPDEDLDIDHHMPSPDDPPLDESRGMGQLTAAAVFLGVSIAVGIAILEGLRWATNQAGSTIFDQFPLFPFTIIGGVIVQLCAVRFDFEWAVNRRAVEGIGGISVDGIIICAIGTLSLGALADNIPLLLIMSVGSVAWSVFLVLGLGKRIFARDWFEHSVAEFGESQGNVATGFMLVDMVDPARRTNVITAYGYRQLVTRPLVGGGFVTALAVPLIAEWGLTAFTIATAAISIAFGVWGIRQHAAGTVEPVPASRAAPPGPG